MSGRLPSASQQKVLIPLLERLTRAIEELLLTGLVAVSEKSKQTLSVSFQEASRNRLLRLGSTLRVAVEELARYARNDPLFSRRRFTFFINRAWMISRGLLHAIHTCDEKQWRQLTWQAGGRAMPSLDLINLGVIKKVVHNAFVAFEFRLRTVGDAHGIASGTPMIWSTVFPIHAKAQVPPEAYLHLPMPQKFKAADFLQGKVIRLGPVTVSEQGRISLDTETRAELQGEPFSAWHKLLHWDKAAALSRIQAHESGPFDLEIDLQEEVVLKEWQVGEPEENDREQQRVYPIHTPEHVWHASVAINEDNEALHKLMQKFIGVKKKKPLFGVMHYEMCRLMYQPLTIFGKSGPEPLMLSKEKFDPAALVKALNFT